MSENAYKQAGVDVEAGYESVRLIKDDVKKTAIAVSYTHLSSPIISGRA